MGASPGKTTQENSFLIDRRAYLVDLPGYGYARVSQAEKERWAYASELIGDAFQHWGNGRVLLDMGSGRGKNVFIIK